MPYSSADISGMVGGQMAMFSNQASFSQQVGGQLHHGGQQQPQQPTGMANPYPTGNMGSKIAGGAAMALPGVMTGVGIAGGLMGGKAGWLDPFTGVSRAFARGVGAQGAGFTGTLGHVGQAFRMGGLRAGGAMMAGGLGAAAAMAVPYALAGAAVDTVAGNVYQGAQNITEVQNMAGQYFGSQYGAAGSRGGKMGRGTIKQITGVLHELVGDDARATMDDVKKLMDQAGQMGMLTGITDAQQFKSRFSKILKQVRSIADVMGTSLGEAGSMMGQMKQMGLWSTQDIMGTAVSSKMAGAAAPQMMQVMQQGAQISHAMGGTLRAGALMGQQSFRTIQAAMQTGALTEEQLMEYTGGTGGAQGQAQAAGRLTGIISQFGRSAAGRLAMAGLGKVEEGRFTGDIDEEKLAQFRGGQISLRELERMGRKNTRGRRAAVSFHRFEEKLSQNLASQGGVEAFTQLAGEIAETRFKSLGEDALPVLLRQMQGVSARDAEMITNLRKKLPQIAERESRAAIDAINQSFQSLDEKRNRSFGGLMDSLKKSWGDFVSPLQEFGESLATNIGRTGDDITDKIFGRVRRIPIGQQERLKLLRQGALTQDVGSVLQRAKVGPEGQNWVDQGDSWSERIRSGGFFGAVSAGAAGGAVVGGVAGAFVGGVGAAPGATVGAIGGGIGAGLGFLTGPQGNPRVKALMDAGVRLSEQGDVDLGGGLTTSAADMRAAANDAYRRAQGGKMVNTDTDPKRKAMSRVQHILKTIMTDPDQLKELKELKEKDPQGYAMELAKRVRRSGGGESMDLLKGEKGASGDLDVLSDAQTNLGYGGGSHAADFSQVAEGLGYVSLGSKEEIAQAQDKALKQMESAIGGPSATEAMAAGAAAGAVVGFVSPMPGGTVVGGLLGGAAGFIDATIRGMDGVEREDIESVMTGEHSELVQGFLKGDITEEDFLDEVQKRSGKTGGAALAKVSEKLVGRENEGTREKFKAAAGLFTDARKAEVGAEAREQISGIARRSKDAAQIGLAGETGKSYQDILKTLRAGGGELTAAAMGDVHEKMDKMAEEVRGDKDTRKKMRAAGGFAGQIAALADISDMGAMGEKETQAFLAKLKKQTGIDVQAMGGKALKDMLAGGVTREELVGKDGKKGVKDLMGDLAKSMITETAAGMKNVQQQMMDNLRMYTDANRRFVDAVAGVLDKEELVEASEAIEQKRGKLET